MSVVYSAANQASITPTPNEGASGKSQTQLALELNSCRIIAVAEQLIMCAQIPDQPVKFHQLCLSLASELDNEVDEALQNDQHFRRGNCPYVLRQANSVAALWGIDYGLANNEVPAAASKLPQVLKMNACKLGWFSAKDTEELLKLADEVASFFMTNKDLNTDVSNSLPTVSTIMSRGRRREWEGRPGVESRDGGVSGVVEVLSTIKLGHIIASLEVEPGYGTHLVDFHISKDIACSKDEKIRLFVAMKDSIDTSSCIITPQQVKYAGLYSSLFLLLNYHIFLAYNISVLCSILLNGKPVECRNSVVMDHGPQLPTIVNPSLKYGINLLQVMGQFNGHFILIVALMSVIPSSDLQPPVDYVQPASAVSNSDAEIIEGPSRVSLSCPISKKRIRTPVKGNSCKHYQCFDFNNYVEINSRRPSWRCPSCNQSVCFTDLRVDQKMVKALKEMGENISEVIISVDGTWTAASSDKHKDETHHKTSANQQEGQELEESSGMLDASDNVYDLTGEDDEMDTNDRSEPLDTKPVVNNTHGQSAPSFKLPPVFLNTIDLAQFSTGQAVNSAYPRAMSNFGSSGFNFRPHAQVGGTSGTSTSGINPVLTDAVSPALNRQPDNFQGTNRSPSYAQNSASTPTPTSLQLQEALISQGLMNNFHLIPRNVTRVPNAIQALPVPSTPQQHSRPTVSSPVGSGSVPFQRSVAGSNAHAPSPFGGNIERQRHISQPSISPHMSNMSSRPQLNRSASLGVSHSNPSHNMPMPQTLSQPPHLMRTSQLPRNHNAASPRMGVNNSPSTLQRVQLTPLQGSHVRQQPQTMPLQTQAVRTMSSLPLNSGATPQAVSRPESLIDLQTEQNWRPSGRMRGALTGKAYSDALNQYMGQAAQPVQTPSPRPPVSPASSLPSSVNNVLLANRRIATECQDQSTTVPGAVNTKEQGSQG
ncbi:E4 SUMO-protein ligase PIAL2 [Bienertia sinuspersici]